MSKLNANVVLVDSVTGDRVFLAAGTEPTKEQADQLGEHLFGHDAEEKDAKPDRKPRSK